MRWFSCVVALVVALVGVRAGADPLFDRGVALAALADSLLTAENAGDAGAVMELFLPGDEVAYYADGDEATGHDAALAAVTRRLGGLPAGALAATAPRVLVEASTGWIVVDWEWGGESGRHIVRARRVGGAWAFAAFDFDGDSADGVVGVFGGGFDSSTAISAVDGPMRAMEKSAAAFADGDQVAMDSVLVAEKGDFVFTTVNGEEWFGEDGIIRAGIAVALNEAPEGIAQDKMTLFVGAGLGRAIAFQTIDGQRVSLQLERRDRWRVVAASLSAPLDVLLVSPMGAVITTWAELRRRAR